MFQSENFPQNPKILPGDHAVPKGFRDFGIYVQAGIEDEVLLKMGLGWNYWRATF